MALLGSHPHGSRPHGSRPLGSRPHVFRPHGSRPHGSHPHGSRPQGSHPHSSRPHSSRPQAPVEILLFTRSCSSCSVSPRSRFPCSRPHAPVPKNKSFQSYKIKTFQSYKKIAPVLILRSSFSGISRTFTIFMLEAMWCEGSNPHGVEAL